MSFPSLERAMYFSVALIVSTEHVDPVQVIPPLFAVTVGVAEDVGVGLRVGVAVGVAVGSDIGPARSGPVTAKDTTVVGRIQNSFVN